MKSKSIGAGLKNIRNLHEIVTLIYDVESTKSIAAVLVLHQKDLTTKDLLYVIWLVDESRSLRLLELAVSGKIEKLALPENVVDTVRRGNIEALIYRREIDVVFQVIGRNRLELSK